MWSVYPKTTALKAIKLKATIMVVRENFTILTVISCSIEFIYDGVIVGFNQRN